MPDPHKNFAYSLVATAPSPATSGTSLVVTAAQGALFPAVPFNVTIWPTGTQPTDANAEVARCTARTTDTLTLVRAQEGSTARTVVVGDQIAATVTAKTLTDIETYALPVFNVKDAAYGATGDGTTNDSTAINAALTAANAAGGGVVFFPKGTYLANSLVIPGGNIRLMGSGWGSVLKQTAAAADNTYLLSAFGSGITTASNLVNIGISDLQLLGRCDTDIFTQYVHLMCFSGVSDVVIERVFFNKFRGDGIYLGSILNGGTAVERHNARFTVRDCRFDGGTALNNRNGITITDCTDLYIETNAFASCTASGMPGAIDIEPNAVTYTQLRNLNIKGNMFDGVGGDAGVVGYFHTTAQASLTTPVQDITIEGNTFRNTVNSTGPIFMRMEQTPTASTPRHQVLIVGNQVLDSPNVPVDIEGIRGLRMERNYFASSQNSFSIGYSELVMDIVFTDNDLYNVGLSEGTAISIFSATRFRIERNVFDAIGDQAGTGRLTSFNAGSGGASTSSNISFIGNRVVGFASTISGKAAGHTLSQSTNEYRDNDLASNALVPTSTHWFTRVWTTLSKAANQARINSSTLVDDDTMVFTMQASTTYRVRGKIFFDTTAASDMKYTFIGPASPTLFRGHLIANAAGTTPVIAGILVAYPSSSGVALAGTGTTGGHIEFDLIVQNGVTAGTFKFQFAQNTATADTGAIVLGGSYMEYQVA